MEIVVPLRVVLALGEAVGVVALVLQDQVDVAAVTPRADLGGHRVEEGVVLDRVHRVEAQAVEAVLLQPHQRVVDEDSGAPAPASTATAPPQGVSTSGWKKPRA